MPDTPQESARLEFIDDLLEALFDSVLSNLDTDEITKGKDALMQCLKEYFDEPLDYREAPELLEACEYMMQLMKEHEDIIPVEAMVANEGASKMLQAISKAKGE